MLAGRQHQTQCSGPTADFGQRSLGQLVNGFGANSRPKSGQIVQTPQAGHGFAGQKGGIQSPGRCPGQNLKGEGLGRVVLCQQLTYGLQDARLVSRAGTSAHEHQAIDGPVLRNLKLSCQTVNVHGRVWVGALGVRFKGFSIFFHDPSFDPKS